MQISNYSIKDILAEWQAKLLLSQDIKQHIKKGVVLSISGEGGGAWLFQPFQLTQITSKFDDSDCILYLDTETLIDIYIGKITPQEAYLTNALKIIGDESIAIYFSFLMIQSN